MNTYKTIDVARIIGIHVNTVRLYEELGLIPKPARLNNGYRVFTDIHIEQFKLARAALKVEILQNGLRKQVIQIIKIAALGDYETALNLNYQYRKQIETEIQNAEEAINITLDILSGIDKNNLDSHLCYTRKEVSTALQVTVDTLRNWELNGLFSIKRSNNGYRVYTQKDLQLLKIIRSLRCANYSLSAILRMLHALSINPSTNIRDVIDTPAINDDIITACDQLLTSLHEAKHNSYYVEDQLEIMRQLSK